MKSKSAWCKLVVVKDRIEMNFRGRGMKENPGKEVGCSDRQWMGERGGRSEVILLVYM